MSDETVSELQPEDVDANDAALQGGQPAAGADQADGAPSDGDATERDSGSGDDDDDDDEAPPDLVYKHDDDDVEYTWYHEKYGDQVLIDRANRATDKMAEKLDTVLPKESAQMAREFAKQSACNVMFIVSMLPAILGMACGNKLVGLVELVGAVAARQHRRPGCAVIGWGQLHVAAFAAATALDGSCAPISALGFPLSASESFCACRGVCVRDVRVCEMCVCASAMVSSNMNCYTEIHIHFYHLKHLWSAPLLHFHFYHLCGALHVVSTFIICWAFYFFHCS